MRRTPRVALIILACVALLAPSAFVAPAEPAPNLLANPDFAKGAGNSPDHWRTESWNQKPSVTTYRWIPPSGANPGQLEVDSVQPNDARWMQSLSLAGGWYYMSVDIRTEDVPANELGASISILEDGITSQDLKGTTPWTTEGFYLKVGRRGADLELALRLGGYGSLNKGRAFFRHASVTKIAAPPQGAIRLFELDAIREASLPKPLGRPWTLFATFLLLGAVAAAGWRLYGDAALHPAPIVQKPAEPPKPAKGSKKRRRNR